MNTEKKTIKNDKDLGNIAKIKSYRIFYRCPSTLRWKCSRPSPSPVHRWYSVSYDKAYPKKEWRL